MFKKFFSRNKSKTTTVVKPEPIVTVTESESLAQWAEKIANAEGKILNQHLQHLSEKITQAKFDAHETVQLLNGLPAIMFSIQQDLEVGEVTDDQWEQLVSVGYTAKIRKIAADKVEGESTLQRLIKQTKGKDKAVFRILQDKLESIHTAKKAVDADLEKQKAIVDALARLATGAVDPMFSAKVKGLQEQWSGVVQADPELQAEFDRLLVGIVEKLEPAEVEQEVAVAPEAEAPVVEESTPEAPSEADAARVREQRTALIARLRSHLVALVCKSDPLESDWLEAQTLLSQAQHQWREAEDIIKASKEENASFHQISTAYDVGLLKLKALMQTYGSFEKVAELIANKNDGVDDIVTSFEDCYLDIQFVLETQPAAMANVLVAIAEYQKTIEAGRQQEINQVRAIRSQMRRCIAAVEEGHLRRASGLYHGVMEKLEGFDLDKHSGVKKQLDDTTEALEKLRDWQTYAVLPKKQALIKRMESLVNQSMDPDSRSQAIKDMQDEWKNLSRGLQDRQQDLWETFHDLAQKAYEPCHEYFNEQRNLRAVNLEKRKEVVDQLKTYEGLVDWSQPDVKEVDRVLQIARNDWRKYSPVDRIANKETQADFDRVHQAMFNRMRDEQEKFKENKRNIIKQAESLLVAEDIKAATVEVKSLQQRWKNAGLVARKDEQALWKQFREVCDELFARRDQQVNEFKSDLSANKHKAEEVIASIEQLLNSEDISAQRTAFLELKQVYENVGTLPKTHFQKLTKQYREACAQFEALCKDSKLAKEDEHWQNLFGWVKSARFSENSEEELMRQWANIEIPTQAKGLNEQLSAWLQPANELNQILMHEKTIDFEILVGVDSPKEDASVRMNLQVQRLSDGIGASDTEADINQAVVDWLAVGAVELADYERFEQRVKKARNYWIQKKIK